MAEQWAGKVENETITVRDLYDFATRSGAEDFEIVAFRDEESDNTTPIYEVFVNRDKRQIEVF